MNARHDLLAVTPIHTPAGFSAAEWLTRVELAACYRMIHHHGWTTQVYNHITARIPDTEAILINPFGLRYDEITALSLVKIDLNGNKLDDSPYPVNQAGFVIHSAIHSARPDLQCTLHTHSENAEALSCLAEGFVPMTQTGAMFHERVGYHSYEGIALDSDERSRLVADLGPTNHTLVLRNHGVLVGGDSIACAYTRLYNFENAARTQLKVYASGARITLPSDEVMRHTRDQFESGDSQAGANTRYPEWPAALRLLDQLDPRWRT